MKAVARITSKGQITLPKTVRQSLGVKAGDRVAFEEQQGRIQVVPMRDASIQDVLERYRGIGSPGTGSSKEEVVDYVRALRGWDEADYQDVGSTKSAKTAAGRSKA